MGCVDEMARRQRVVSWSFVDFLEGLCRLGETMSLPTEERLEDARQDAAGRVETEFANEGKFAYWDYHVRLDAAARVQYQHASTSEADNRPLVEKMDALLHLAMAGLCEQWGIPECSEAKLIPKLKSMAAFLSGGIEI